MKNQWQFAYYELIDDSQVTQDDYQQLMNTCNGINSCMWGRKICNQSEAT